MPRPIKKAHVTRRRKYYGGGKKMGGTTLKKVGGGNKTRQIKRCRGSKKGGGTKRKVGGSGGESSAEDFLKVTDNSTITNDPQRQEAERENLWKRLQEARADFPNMWLSDHQIVERIIKIDDKRNLKCAVFNVLGYGVSAARSFNTETEKDYNSMFNKLPEQDFFGEEAILGPMFVIAQNLNKEKDALKDANKSGDEEKQTAIKAKIANLENNLNNEKLRLTTNEEVFNTFLRTGSMRELGEYILKQKEYLKKFYNEKDYFKFDDQKRRKISNLPGYTYIKGVESLNENLFNALDVLRNNENENIEVKNYFLKHFFKFLIADAENISSIKDIKKKIGEIFAGGILGGFEAYHDDKKTLDYFSKGNPKKQEFIKNQIVRLIKNDVDIICLVEYDMENTDTDKDYVKNQNTTTIEGMATEIAKGVRDGMETRTVRLKDGPQKDFYCIKKFEENQSLLVISTYEFDEIKKYGRYNIDELKDVKGNTQDFFIDIRLKNPKLLIRACHSKSLAGPGLKPLKKSLNEIDVIFNGILEEGGYLEWTDGVGKELKKAGLPDIILGDLNIPAFPEEEEGDWSESLFGTIDDTAVHHHPNGAEELKYPKNGDTYDYNKGYEPFKTRMKEVSNLIRKSYEGFEYISEDKVFPKTRTKRAFFNVQAILGKVYSRRRYNTDFILANRENLSTIDNKPHDIYPDMSKAVKNIENIRNTVNGVENIENIRNVVKGVDIDDTKIVIPYILPEPNGRATWTAAMSRLINDKNNSYDNLIIAIDNTGPDKKKSGVTLGQWKRVANPDEGQDINFYKKYDLGGGDQKILDNLIEKWNVENSNSDLGSSLKDFIKEDLKRREKPKVELLEQLDQKGTLITGGTLEKRSENLNGFINKQILDENSYALIPQMETKLTAISFYEKACTYFLADSQLKTLCLIPVGSTDAHIITYTKTINGVNVKTQTFCDFVKKETLQELEECDKYIFAGSASYYVDTPENREKMKNSTDIKGIIIDENNKKAGDFIKLLEKMPNSKFEGYEIANPSAQQPVNYIPNDIFINNDFVE